MIKNSVAIGCIWLVWLVWLVSLASFCIAGCGSRHSTLGNGMGSVTGTVTRVVIPGVPGGEISRYPSADTDISILQDTVFTGKATTDSKGRFSISLPAGRYILRPTLSLTERVYAIIKDTAVEVRGGETVPVALEVTIPLP